MTIDWSRRRSKICATRNVHFVTFGVRNRARLDIEAGARCDGAHHSPKGRLDFSGKKSSHLAMGTILIAYDIHPSAGEACERIADAIRSLGEWWHHLESTWLVKTDRRPEQIRDLLREHIGSDDQLLIVDISRDAAACFGVNDAGSRWLEANLSMTSH